MDNEQNNLNDDNTPNEENIEEPPLEAFLFDEEENEKNENKKKQRAFFGKITAFIITIAMLLTALGVWVQVFNLPSFSFLKKSNELSQVENIQNYKKAVVTIEGGNSKGTGFNIDSNGRIITNHHVIDGMSSILVVFPDGEFYKAEKKKTYENLDIALLEIDGKDLPHLDIQQERNWKTGGNIFVIGNPLAYSQIVMEGNITASGDLLKISAPIEKGNSGSPVIDNKGKVIGVVYAKTLPKLGSGEESEGLAVPVDKIPELTQE
jgi:serine protease Do